MPSLNGIASLWILFMMYSFAGWCCESTACSYRQRKFVNRGFLNGPYLPIYGSGSLAAIVLLKDVQNPVLLFLLGGLLTCTIEYLTSYVMERIYHARWWDYSKRPLNLHGRVWIGGFFEFGVGILCVMYLALPGFTYLIGQIPDALLVPVAVVLLAIFLSDLAVTNIGLKRFRAKLDSILVDLKDRMSTLRESVPSRADLAQAVGWERVRDWSLSGHISDAMEKIGGQMPSVPRPTMPQIPSLEEIGEKFSHALNGQERRVVRAFPHIEPVDYQSYVDDLYEQLRKLGK